MTINELDKTLTNRKKGLAYRMWKQADLIGAMFSKNPPKTYEEACKELIPQKPKPRILMPSGLLGKKGGTNGKH